MTTRRPLPDLHLYLENEGAGDCELKSIAFAQPNVSLTFYDPHHDRRFQVFLADVGFVYFYSNHPQNVMARVRRFADWDAATRDKAFSALVDRTISTLEDPGISQTHPVLFLEPATGGEMIAQCRAISIGEASP